MPLRKLPEKSAATVAMGKMRMSREARRAALLAREEKEKKRDDAMGKGMLTGGQAKLDKNKNIQDIQEKLSLLREDKARNEATLEGIETRKKDLFY